jgi:hypothetical protein
MVQCVMLYIDNMYYQWHGQYGKILSSLENGVKKGDVRVINGTIFYAYLIYKNRFKKNDVCWSVIDVDQEGIKKIKDTFFWNIN